MPCGCLSTEQIVSLDQTHKKSEVRGIQGPNGKAKAGHSNQLVVKKEKYRVNKVTTVPIFSWTVNSRRKRGT